MNWAYDKVEIARIVARIGLGMGEHEDNDEYICSEFVQKCFLATGISFNVDERGFIFPEHIAMDPLMEAIDQMK
ncbi:hypothetical protein [Bacillus sp. 2205SS5-2]|uniref:hypothetical protein n=1 Tax=Bacillus sp. 2205SS5-2 TaxID=3109031 RepID=UPI003003D489